MKTGGTQVKIQAPSNATKFNPNNKIQCTHSSSCAYTQGHVYDVYKNDKGWICVMGDDGIEDVCSMLVSTFKRVTHTLEAV